MASKFPNIPGTYHLLNDGNLNIERVAPGSKAVVLGVTTAPVPINEPISLQDADGRLSVSHPGNGALTLVPSELNKGISEIGKSINVEFIKIAHGWGEEGYLHIGNTDFNGHIITETERYVALEETLDLLLNYNMDVVYIPGIYVDRKAALDEVYLEDGTTLRYSTQVGDLGYQLGEFCDDSVAENQSVISGISRMPIRIKQFYDGCDADYFSLLGYKQVEVVSVTSATKEIVINTAFGTDMPFKGSTIEVNYPTGRRTYTVESDDGVSTLTIQEDNPLEFSPVPVLPSSSSGISSSSAPSSSSGIIAVLKATMQVFDTSGGDAYDQGLRDKVQSAYRRAFQGLHPTDLTSVNAAVSMKEFDDYLKAALVFTDMLNADGVTAGQSDLYPTNYRWWKQSGGAVSNPDGATGDLSDGKGNPIDLGKWLSLGTLHGKSANSYGDQAFRAIGLASERLYTSTGMGEYLALALKLPENSSTTNKPIDGFVSERDIKKSLLDKLIGSRYIVTSRSPVAGFVVAAGNTAAYLIDNNRRSDFTFLTTVRIINRLLQNGRLIIAPYLGETMNVTAFSALQTDLAEMYRLAVDDGFIFDGFDFNLTQTPDQRVLGHASLDQTVQPAFELRKVFGETNLTK